MYYWRRINIVLIIGLLVLMVPSIWSLLLPGLVITDDLTWMVIRLSAFFDSLKDGQIPVRVVERLNNGYGYPVSNFLYPLFLYLASIIHIIGFGFVDSVKAVLIFSMMASGIFSYFWLKRIFDPIASFIGSLFFVYTPYHLYDLYTRGSVGEILAFVWIPFILWQIERRSLHFIAFGIFLLTISHNSIATISLPMMLMYSLIQKRFKITTLGILLGSLMSSFFIIPAVFELHYTKFSSIKISDPLEYFAKISLIGISSIASFVSIAIIVIKMRGSLRLVQQKGLLLLFVMVGFFSILLSSGVSRPVWEFIPSQFIQFPYRLLSLLIVSASFVAAFVVAKLSGKARIFTSVILLGLLAYSSSFYIFSNGRDMYPDSYYSTNMDTTTVKDEYMPKWVKKKALVMSTKKIEIISGRAEIQSFFINSRKAEIDLLNSDGATIRVNQIYYPGWKAYMNNEELDIRYDNDYGAMDVSPSISGGKLTLIFQETPLRYVSNSISVSALLIGLLLLMRPILKFK